MERVLVVDDDRDCRRALADAFEAKGFPSDMAENGLSALRTLQRDPAAFGFVYADIRMPEVGGLDLVKHIAKLDPTIVSVLLTGDPSPACTVAALRAGAYDFISKPYTLAELETSLARAAERRRLLVQNEEYRKRLEDRHQEEMRKMFVSSIQAHARSIEAKDAYTAGHCDRVDRYAELIARRCGGFDESWIFNLKVASILHDIGKIGVRSAILCKPSQLDDKESVEMRTHPVIGGRIVRTLHGFNLETVVRHHHERFDGKGYPSHLKGDDIPLESRMILIADTFDAMTSDRPYRRALTTDRAANELKRHAGTQFDPDLVSSVLNGIEEFDSARQEMAQKRSGEYFV